MMIICHFNRHLFLCHLIRFCFSFNLDGLCILMCAYLIHLFTLSWWWYSIGVETIVLIKNIFDEIKLNIEIYHLFNYYVCSNFVGSFVFLSCDLKVKIKHQLVLGDDFIAMHPAPTYILIISWSRQIRITSLFSFRSFVHSFCSFIWGWGSMNSVQPMSIFTPI